MWSSFLLNCVLVLVLATRADEAPETHMELDVWPKLDFLSRVQPVPPHLDVISPPKMFWLLGRFEFVTYR